MWETLYDYSVTCYLVIGFCLLFPKLGTVLFYGFGFPEFSKLSALYPVVKTKLNKKKFEKNNKLLLKHETKRIWEYQYVIINFMI